MSPLTIRRSALLGIIPIVTLGLLLVTAAMLRAPWPPDQPASTFGVTVSYFDRIKGRQVGPPPGREADQSSKAVMWYARRVIDGMVLALLVAGYASVTLAIWSNDGRILAVLTVIGGIGTMYGGSLGLYLGPILTTGGFALILFAAGLSWVSQGSGGTKRHKKQSTLETVTQRTGFKEL